MLLLDLSNFLHRALYFAEKEENKLVINNKVNFCIGLFLKMINGELKLFLEDGILAFWDSGVPVFRRVLDRNYKQWKSFNFEENFQPEDHLLSDFNKMSEDEKSAFLEKDLEFLKNYNFCKKILCNELLPAMGIKSIKENNTEADDFIAYTCYLLLKNDYKYKITIVSTDNDYKQLLMNDKIELYNPTTKETLTENIVIKSFKDEDINLSNWREFFIIQKALNGDTSDNIKALKGMGETSAKRYAKKLVCERVKQEDLERCERGNIKAHEFLVSQEGINQLSINKKLIDMTYFIDLEKDYVLKLRRALLNSSLVLSNRELANGILVKYKLEDLYLTVDSIIDCVSSFEENYLYKILKT